MNAEMIERTNFVYVCAHARPSPSIWILIGFKYEIFHLKDSQVLSVVLVSLSMSHVDVVEIRVNVDTCNSFFLTIKRVEMEISVSLFLSVFNTFKVDDCCSCCD